MSALENPSFEPISRLAWPRRGPTGRGDDEIAVTGGEHAIDGRLRQIVPGLRRQLLAVAQRVALHGEVVHADHAIVECRVDMLALARRRAAEERGADSRHTVNPRIHV